MKHIITQLTYRKGECVSDGGDGDGNGSTLQSLTNPLFHRQLGARVAPSRDEDEHVVNTDA